MYYSVYQKDGTQQQHSVNLRLTELDRGVHRKRGECSLDRPHGLCNYVREP